MYFIKIKLKGYLKNINENTVENIDTTAIKNHNIITYNNNDTIHKINILDNKIILSRNNEKFSNELVFELLKDYDTEYYIKELNTSINIKIKTTYLLIENNKIEIHYNVLDSNDEYLYFIEMSD